MTLISKIKYIEKLGPEVLYSFLQEKRMCGNDYCLHQPRPPFPEDKNTIHGPFSFSISEGTMARCGMNTGAMELTTTLVFAADTNIIFSS